jgi:hypothetical protein
MARKLIAEIFTDIADAPTTEDKVMILQANNILVIRQLLLFGYDPSVVIDTIVPVFKENKETDGYAANSLYSEYKRLYIFLASFQKVTPQRKSEILRQILESIDPSDSVFLVKLITRKMDEFGLDKDIINTAFPGLIK